MDQLQWSQHPLSCRLSANHHSPPWLHKDQRPCVSVGGTSKKATAPFVPKNTVACPLGTRYLHPAAVQNGSRLSSAISASGSGPRDGEASVCGPSCAAPLRVKACVQESPFWFIFHARQRRASVCSWVVSTQSSLQMSNYNHLKIT